MRSMPDTGRVYGCSKGAEMATNWPAQTKAQQYQRNRSAEEGIKLTESVDTWASNSRGGTCDRERTGQGSSSAPGNHSPRPGSHWQCRTDVPLLRDHPAVLLRLVSPLRGVRG